MSRGHALGKWWETIPTTSWHREAHCWFRLVTDHAILASLWADKRGKPVLFLLLGDGGLAVEVQPWRATWLLSQESTSVIHYFVVKGWLRWQDGQREGLQLVDPDKPDSKEGFKRRQSGE